MKTKTYGASATADPATQASPGAAKASPPSGECPLREKISEIIRDAADHHGSGVDWAGFADEILDLPEIKEAMALYSELDEWGPKGTWQ